MRVLRILLFAYGIAGALSLLVIPVSAKGWFGLEPDPLAAVFAIMFALPWGLALSMLPGDSLWLATGVLAAGIGLNLFLGMCLLRWLGRGTQRNQAGRVKSIAD